jgi:hypothetical protein
VLVKEPPGFSEAEPGESQKHKALALQKQKSCLSVSCQRDRNLSILEKLV